jgi:hypothetical protein
MAPSLSRRWCHQQQCDHHYHEKGRYKLSPIDLSTIREYVYDEGLVGASQRDLLEKLLEEIGVEEQDEVAIREKLKQKVSNVNRTRREVGVVIYPCIPDFLASNDIVPFVKNLLYVDTETRTSRRDILQKDGPTTASGVGIRGFRKFIANSCYSYY